MNALVAPVELTDAELDAVTGGALVTGGLVNITLDNISILDNNNVPITIKDLANHNNVSVGAINSTARRRRCHSSASGTGLARLASQPRSHFWERGVSLWGNR
jgi:hypothetical protein